MKDTVQKSINPSASIDILCYESTHTFFSTDPSSFFTSTELRRWTLNNYQSCHFIVTPNHVTSSKPFVPIIDPLTILIMERQTFLPCLIKSAVFLDSLCFTYPCIIYYRRLLILNCEGWKSNQVAATINWFYQIL